MWDVRIPSDVVLFLMVSSDGDSYDPRYRPTLSEFQDPIAYIFKIEKEASQCGICEIIPPVAPAPKKTAIRNLNRSVSAPAEANASSDSKPAPTFTTRRQQIGFCPRKHRPVQKPYAKDRPGSAYLPLNSKKSSWGGREAGEGVTIGETLVIVKVREGGDSGCYFPCGVHCNVVQEGDLFNALPV
ncbi:hypothetical protein Goshw_022743 [Gossypium schwendimanii]|uniref:JmjN domain-containing protein n=1 Tax=Gossypium schwendimanii TaxID=34291 RepID=A0A7J9KYR7_GOSSC|nr:hypothetical protein [Gossypium schwendimanii]